MTYNITEAKKNIDLIVSLAEAGEPQIIRRRNKEIAVMVSVGDWGYLCGGDRDDADAGTGSSPQSGRSA